MTSTATTSQVETTLAAVVWESIGMELTIFVVTALCALALKKLPNRRVAPKGKGLVTTKSMPDSKIYTEEPSPQKPAKRDIFPTTPERRRQNLAASPTARNSPAPAASGKQLVGSGDARAAARIIDEVVSSIREQQSMKTATRALSQYEAFQVRMTAAGAPSMEQIALCSRYSPAEFFTTAIQCAVRVGRCNFVDVIIQDMTVHGVSRSLGFYEAAMKQLAGQKQYRQALAVYDHLEADGLRPSVVTCSCLIGFAAEVGELDRAVQFFRTLSSMTTPSIRAYMTLLRVHAKRQDWPASLAVYHEMSERRVKPDSLVLNFILATGVAADQVEAAATLVEEAQRERPPICDVVSYNTIVKGFTQRNDAEGALKIIAQMEARGVRPNSITFNTAMDAAVRGNKSSEAWQVLSTMRRAGLPPDKFTCSILVKGFAKGGARDRLEGGLELLEEVGPKCDSTLLTMLYNTVLEAAAFDENLVSRTFAQMRRANVSPSAAAQRLLVQMLPHAGADRPLGRGAQLGGEPAPEGAAAL